MDGDFAPEERNVCSTKVVPRLPLRRSGIQFRSSGAKTIMDSYSTNMLLLRSNELAEKLATWH